jgi:hypothetical protein
MGVSTAGIAAHGSIYYSGAVSSSGQTVGTTATKMTLFNGNGISHQTTPDHTNDKITILIPGTYKVSYSFSFGGTANITWTMTVYKNGVATSIKAYRKLGAGGDVGAGHVEDFLELAVNDYIELYLTASSASSDYDLGSAFLSVQLVD